MSRNQGLHLWNKSAVIILVLAIALSGIGTFAKAADSCPILSSPDHPEIWYAYDYDKLSQSLQWNDEDGTLVAHVTYNLIPCNEDLNPADYETFVLRFPNVRLNRTERTLYFMDEHKRKVVLGHLVEGVFGPHIVLEKNLELSAHRRKGKLYAALVMAR